MGCSRVAEGVAVGEGVGIEALSVAVGVSSRVADEVDTDSVGVGAGTTSCARCRISCFCWAIKTVKGIAAKIAMRANTLSIFKECSFPSRFFTINLAY